MKVLIWHGYLLGGTGSNVYTSSLARAWSRLGHEVVVFAQEPHPERFDLGGATFVRPDDRATCCRSSCSTATRTPRPAACPELAWAERGAWVERERGRDPRAPAGRPRVRQPRAARGRRSASRRGRRSRSRRTARSSSSPCAATRSSRAWARESLAGADDVLAGSEHIQRVLEEVVGPGAYLERVRIVRRASTSTRSGRAAGRGAGRGCSRRPASTRPASASAIPTRATRSGWRRSSAATGRPSSSSASSAGEGRRRAPRGPRSAWRRAPSSSASGPSAMS